MDGWQNIKALKGKERRKRERKKQRKKLTKDRKNKAIYMTALVTCSWAGVVMWWAEAVGSAIYTTASIACNWVGVVM